MKRVILKPGKEKALLSRHPWIFSGAIEKLPSCEPGEILSVYSSDGKFLAKAYFNPEASLVGRVLTFSDVPIEQAIRKAIDEAYALRKAVMRDANAFRLINAEGDNLSGLIVDCYADVVVMQIHTWGMEKLKPLLIQILQELLKPKTIYEKSLSSARAQEGLPETQGVLFGEEVTQVEIQEGSLRFSIPIQEGQKTGFFLDQREMRKLVKELASGRRVLNCFSYTGGFSIAALAGGANFVRSVDISAPVLAIAEKNSKLNGVSDKHECVEADVFDYLRDEKLDFDFLILDPPAFAKKRSDQEAACRGYKEINRLALLKAKPRSLLLTSSCSYYVDQGLFQTVLFQAARDANRNVRILSHHHLSPDHPISLYHPEGSYLKSLLLYVE
jgi:23S rRNA (cytosine1962-C5)-methyltransferase